MQGFKTFILLAVVVLVGLVRAAPADYELPGLEQWPELDGMEQLPELLIWPSAAELSDAPTARRCTATVCRTLCRRIGFRNSVCLSATRCRCSN